MKELKRLIFIGLLIITTTTTLASPLSGSVWKQVQDWRVESGRSVYRKDYYLCYVASKRAKEIQTDWSHSGFWAYVPVMFKLGYKHIGENLAKDFNDAESTLNAWLSSDTHRANLENDYTHSCVSCSNGYCVQMFSRRR